MKTRHPMIKVAIAILAIGVAVPIPEASAIPPSKRLGTDRSHHVSDDAGKKTTIADLIARRAAAKRECCAKSVCVCPCARAKSLRSKAEETSSRPRKIRPYWQRKR